MSDIKPLSQTTTLHEGWESFEPVITRSIGVKNMPAEEAAAVLQMARVCFYAGAKAYEHLMTLALLLDTGSDTKDAMMLFHAELEEFSASVRVKNKGSTS